MAVTAVTAVGALSCCSISLMHAVSVRRRHGIEIRPRRRPGPIAVAREIRSIHGAPHEHRDRNPSDRLDAAGSVTLSIRACVLHEWAACGNRQRAAAVSFRAFSPSSPCLTATARMSRISRREAPGLPPLRRFKPRGPGGSVKPCGPRLSGRACSPGTYSSATQIRPVRAGFHVHASVKMRALTFDHG